MSKGKIDEIINSLPKTEVHIHAEAVISYESYHELNQKYKINTDLRTPADFGKLFDIKSLKDMLQNFFFLQSFFKASEDFSYMVKDIERYCQANNIGYIELHVSPSMILRSGRLDFSGLVDPIVEGLDAVAARGGPDGRILIDVSRSFGPENARNNVKELLAYLAKKRTRRIIGVGLGGQEIGNPCTDYKDILAEARGAGLHVVAHAGEEVGPESIWEAVRDVKAERIGHGTSAIFDDSLMTFLAERRIPLEVCPTSNIVTGKYVKKYEEHPLRTFVERGLLVTINTDDPNLFDIDLNGEYRNVAAAFGYGLDEISALLGNGIEACFLDEAGKAALRKKLDGAVAALRSA